MYYMEKYPTELIIQPYNNNLEYRNQFRILTNMDIKLCNLKIQEKDSNHEWDPETIDEELYDEKAVSNFIDLILLHTKNNTLFQQIYYKAANQMLSEDYEVGLTILLSYDYLFYFHLCLVDFFKNNNHIDASNENYKKILSLL